MTSGDPTLPERPANPDVPPGERTRIYTGPIAGSGDTPPARGTPPPGGPSDSTWERYQRGILIALCVLIGIAAVLLVVFVFADSGDSGDKPAPSTTISSVATTSGSTSAATSGTTSPPTTAPPTTEPPTTAPPTTSIVTVTLVPPT